MTPLEELAARYMTLIDPFVQPDYHDVVKQCIQAACAEWHFYKLTQPKEATQ